VAHEQTGYALIARVPRGDLTRRFAAPGRACLSFATKISLPFVSSPTGRSRCCGSVSRNRAP